MDQQKNFKMLPCLGDNVAFFQHTRSTYCCSMVPTRQQREGTLIKELQLLGRVCKTVGILYSFAALLIDRPPSFTIAIASSRSCYVLHWCSTLQG